LPHVHLGRNAFAQNVGQTRRGKKPHDPSPDHPDQGHLAQPLLDAFASVLCRQGGRETASATGSPNIYLYDAKVSVLGEYIWG
jgi:hypothetical protein